MIVPKINPQILTNRYLISVFCMFLLAGCASSKRTSVNRGKTYKYKSEKAYKNRTPNREPTTKSEYSNANSENKLEEVIAIARSYTGVPYRWGGTTRSGMDCSGLLMTCFQAADLNIPRTTAEQVKVGKGIRLYDLQPGDLVFFAAKKSNPNKVTHVGMVTEVRDKHDVRFIHASTKLGVVENNIYSDYYRKIFIKARRPF